MSHKKRTKNNLAVNAILNGFRSSLSIIFPIITYPYVYRILHANGIGKVDYANSIVSYFSLIAMLGIQSYIIREGAKVRNDIIKLRQLASEVFTINLISTGAAYTLLALCLCNIEKLNDYKTLIIICSGTIIFNTLSVDWVNTIFEDYLYITVRSIVIRLISIAMLFALVRDQNDYYKYAAISVVTDAVNCIMNWFYCRKYIKIKPTRKINAKKHLKPILILFANNIATSIYVNSDTTMLGWIAGDTAVGMYSIAVKIYNVIKYMLAAMYAVTIPRISFYLGTNDIAAVKRTYSKIANTITIVLLPIAAGIIAVSDKLILIIGGKEYSDAIPTLIILSVALIGAIFGGLITSCLNIPLGREKYNFIATLISALINVGLNIFFIPVMQQNGAAITTAISEFFVFIFCLITFKNISEYLAVNKWIHNLLQALLGSVIILVIGAFTHRFIQSTIINLITTIILSIAAYSIELILLKNEYIFEIIKSVRDKLHK